MLVSF